MADRIGQRIDDYYLRRLIGVGAFGEVYLGEHIHEHTPVAVKVLKVHLTPDTLKDFLHEARMIKLQHSNIVPIRDFGVENDVPFLIMDYVPNGTLYQRHPLGTRLPLDLVCSYVNQAGSALQYAHDRRLIHRDVKPQNMLLGQKQQILLADFGIATIAHSEHSLRTQEMVGTIPYMAPEQIQGKPRPASDQYALGICTYQWLTGERPFHGTPWEIISQHCNVPPPSLLQRAPGVPQEVERVVMKCLAKEPEERFANIRTFATALFDASLSMTHYSVPDLFEPNPEPPVTLSSEEAVVTVKPLPEIKKQSSSSLPSLSWNLSRRKILVGAAGLAIGTGALVALWEIQTTPSKATQAGPPIGTALYIRKGPYFATATTVAWSPDGKRIVSGSGDKTVQVWDAADGSHSYTYRGHFSYVYAVAWSPDGKRIASGGNDETVQIWDDNNGTLLYKYTGHSDYINQVAWSPDGKQIASGSSDKTVQVWNASNDSHLYTYTGHTSFVNAVAWSPDSQRIASGGSDGTVQVWDRVDGARLYTHQQKYSIVNAVTWSPDGKRIASTGDTSAPVQVWNALDGTGAYIYTGHTDFVITVAWSPDGKRIASGGSDYTVQVWDASNGTLLYKYTGHDKPVYTVAWSPDGKRIASGGADGTVQVWEAS
ncbi:MAG: protein kinase [Ktedonobacteraceae bacterium]|nr:protein kinase [Ktedonobacteraceae bacterium]